MHRITAARPVTKQVVSPGRVLSKLKHSCLARVDIDRLNSVRVGICSALVVSFCTVEQIILRWKYQVSEIPERFIKNTSYAFGALLVFASISYVTFVTSTDWGSSPERNVLASQHAQSINNMMFEINEESLSRAEASVDDAPMAIADNMVSQPVILMEDHTESQKTGSQYNDNVELESLLSLIKNTAALDGNALEGFVKTEAELLNFLDQSPHMIQPLLNNYEQLPDGKTKDLLRSLLATTGSLEIEQRAIEQITSGDLASRADWLAVLRDTGIHTSQGRSALLSQLPNFDQPEELSSAILAFAPEIVSASQKQDLIYQLSPYLSHDDDSVRNAAVVSLSKWADSDQPYILEQALTDSSETVRQAAVSAAFTSTIKSDHIKTHLLGIMRDDNESWPLRMDAHNALTGYTLQGQEYDEFFQFHKEQTENINISEAKG